MTATALMLPALLVLSTTAGVDGFVVCTDDKGPTGADRSSCGCCSDAVSHGDEQPERVPASPSCNDCIDVPMSVPSVESRAPLLSASHSTIEATIVAPESALGCSVGLAVAENRSDQHWRLLIPLSTIVILT